jgi:4-amino-4-deoxy-L-arabinose transferase-like glycosyltransferase
MRTIFGSITATRLRTLEAIALAALTLRLAVALFAYGHRDIVGMLWPRGVEALGIAKSLLLGTGFASPFSLPTGPTAFLTPVYPVMLAGIEWLFGIASPASAWAIVCMQCLFSALTCVAIYFLGNKMFDERTARRAAWIWALFPYAIILPTNIIWESSLSALILTLGLFAFLTMIRSQSCVTWALVGAYWAFACLVNATLLLLLPALLIFVVSRDRHLGYRAILCAATFLICLLPWSIRNYTTFHKLFPLRDNFALELWIGNYDGATIRSTAEIHPAFNMREVQRYQSLGEIQYMAEKRDIAVASIKAHPFLFVKNSVKRFFTYWFVNWHPLWLLIPVLTVGGFAGLALISSRAHPLAWIVWIPLVFYPLPYYITHPDLKYQHPLQPLLAILCAYALSPRFEANRLARSIPLTSLSASAPKHRLHPPQKSLLACFWVQ